MTIEHLNDFWQAIVTATALRVKTAQQQGPQAQLMQMPLFKRQPHDVAALFAKGGNNVIAEIKFASPSEGVIHQPTDPLKIAADYINNKACMISVLTEPSYFKGDINYLSAIRNALPAARLLQKDFILDPYQLYQAKAYGADCVLLIMAFNPLPLTQELFNLSKALGLTALVEVHDEQEATAALLMGASLIGVNNRNLKTLKTDLNIARRLIAYRQVNTRFICESGLNNAADIIEMRNIGYDGFLIGTHFMRSENPGIVLQALNAQLNLLGEKHD